MTLPCSKETIDIIKRNNLVCKNKDFCNVVMPSEDTKILAFNQYQFNQKYYKAPFIIYGDRECIIEFLILWHV